MMNCCPTVSAKYPLLPQALLFCRPFFLWQMCLLCTAILSSLLTAQYSMVDSGAHSEGHLTGKEATSHLVLDILLTVVTFLTPAIVIVVQVTCGMIVGMALRPHAASESKLSETRCRGCSQYVAQPEL